MALGRSKIGPYSVMRSLRNEMNGWKYELGLITNQGMRRKFSAKQLRKMIKENQVKMSKIRATEKAKKKKKLTS